LSDPLSFRKGDTQSARHLLKPKIPSAWKDLPSMALDKALIRFSQGRRIPEFVILVRQP
jgi:hypothetical protein